MYSNVAHIILNEIFLSPEALKKKHSTNVFSNLNSIECNIDKFNSIQKEFSDKNYFIHGFGKVYIYAFSEIYPFVIDIFDDKVNPKERKLISVCYGSRGNFCLSLEVKEWANYSCKIIPIIHIFPNKLVSIIFSCYLEVKEHQNLCKYIKELKRFFWGSNKKYSLKCSKPKLANLHTFEQVKSYMCTSISKTMQEYDFENCDNKRHFFVQILKIKEENIAQSDKEYFKKLCYCITEKTELKNESFSFIEREYFFKKYDYNLILPKISINMNSNCLDAKKKVMKKIRYDGWKIFCRIEYAQCENLILRYLIRKASEIQNKFRYEGRELTRTVLLPTRTEPEIDELFVLHTDLYKYDPFTRKILYIYNEGKENFKEIIDITIRKMDMANEILDNRESVWKFVLKKLLNM